MLPVMIYICFGREDDYYQTLFSIISFFKNTTYFKHNDHQLIIYTDNSEFFKKYLTTTKYNITFYQLTSHELKRLMGAEIYQQAFRVKLALIAKTLGEYKRNVFYIDADTFVTKDIVGELMIDSTISGMHDDEGLIIHKKNNEPALDILNKYPKYFSDVNHIKMYNAGLILIHIENSHLIQKALDIMDELYPKHNYYFFEQMLVSYFLGTQTKIKTFDKYLVHYWYMKSFTLKIKDYISSLPVNILDNDFLPELPIGQVPDEKTYRSFIYQWPIKIKKRLKLWGFYS